MTPNTQVSNPTHVNPHVHTRAPHHHRLPHVHTRDTAPHRKHHATTSALHSHQSMQRGNPLAAPHAPARVSLVGRSFPLGALLALRLQQAASKLVNAASKQARVPGFRA